MSKKLEKAWREFEGKVIPATADEAQRRDMRGAFFAGASVAFFAVMEAGDPSTEEPTEEELQALTDLHEELKAEAKRNVRLYAGRMGRH